MNPIHAAVMDVLRQNVMEAKAARIAHWARLKDRPKTLADLRAANALSRAIADSEELYGESLRKLALANGFARR
jgi:hypothetical protein